MSTFNEELRRGLELVDRTGRPIRYRYLDPSDDIEAITTLLNQAYAPLAAAGMRFVASYQDSAETRRRAARGETVVAVDAGTVVGIITLSEPESTGGSPFYDRPDVASVGQFAVSPSHQRSGIGSALLRLVERRAREKRISALGLDTSEHAAGLIALYEAKGYGFIEYAQWGRTNYRSVILGKALAEAHPENGTSFRNVASTQR